MKRKKNAKRKTKRPLRPKNVKRENITELLASKKGKYTEEESLELLKRMKKLQSLKEELEKISLSKKPQKVE